MTGSITRIDVRGHRNTASGGEEFYWVLQTTLPVTDRFRSVRSFRTRAAAVADFEATAAEMGWKLDDEE